MAHVPHLLLPPPWPEEIIGLSPEHRRHLTTVLRRGSGSPVSYTDGRGTVGTGSLVERGVERGGERVEPAPDDRITLAVAPPDSKDRIRWLVEKCTELGVGRIRWLQTDHGQGRVPRPDRAQAWMASAVEQSRRAWVTEVDADWCSPDDLGTYLAAEAGGAPFRPSGSTTLAIGPEGGWSQAELDRFTQVVSLGSGVLRTETAAVAAAAIFEAARNL